jgi:hypothetical protein
MLLDPTVELTREESEGIADFLSLVEGIVVVARIEPEATAGATTTRYSQGRGHGEPAGVGCPGLLGLKNGDALG